MRRSLAVLAVAVALVGAVNAADAAPAHHDDHGRMTRREWVNAVLRHTDGINRAEARRIWRHPKLRWSLPVTSHVTESGTDWSSPAIAAQATRGCKVWTSRTEYGYGIRMIGGTPWPVREPVFRYTLWRTWSYDGWRVYPEQQWDEDWIAPFADLRWNFDGAFDIEDIFFPVGGSKFATHRHSRQGRFTSIAQLGAGRTDLPVSILAKWHGGWEAGGHSAHFCEDN